MAGKSLGTAQHLLTRVTSPRSRASACSGGCFHSETYVRPCGLGGTRLLDQATLDPYG